MAPYRDPDRWGALVSEHRAPGWSWLSAAICAPVIALGLLKLATMGRHTDLRGLVGAGFIAWFGWYCFGEWRRLRTMVVRVYERGLKLDAAGEHQEVAWEDVVRFEAHFWRGWRKDGTANPKNLTQAVIVSATDSVLIRKELVGFRELVAQLARVIKAPRVDLLIVSRKK